MRRHIPNSIRAFRDMRVPLPRQLDIAKRVGCTRSAIGKWERGERLPTLEMAFRLAVVLGKSVDEIFWGARDDALVFLANKPEPTRSCDVPDAVDQLRDRLERLDKTSAPQLGPEAPRPQAPTARQGDSPALTRTQARVPEKVR